jgi:dTDP-glucose 4,6-dehydratase
VRFLVTGGAGFIGSNFVHRLLGLRPDAKVTVLDALKYAADRENLLGLEAYGDRFEMVLGDILNDELVRALVSKSDVIVHFAAESHNDNSLLNPGEFVSTNILGTFNLIQAAVTFDVRFHHVSTDEVFGDLSLDSLSKFNSETPYNPSSPYSATKAASDHLVRAWVRSFGLKATLSNCSNNYGIRQHEEKLIPRTIMLVAAGAKPKVYGTGSNVRDWIHVDDHTDGILAILDRGSIGSTYLLGANCERSNLQVVTLILQTMGQSGDMIEFVADRPGHDRRYAIDASKTYAEIGWMPSRPDIEESISQLVQFYSRKKISDTNRNQDWSGATHPRTLPLWGNKQP